MGGKKKKSYVIFRNCQNKRLTTLEELKNELDDSSCLADCEFKSAFSHDIVSNKVGANKTARRAAKAWIAEVSAGNVSFGSKPAKETVPVAEAKSVENQASVEKSTPVVEEPPVKEAQPVEEAQPVQEATLVEKAEPVEEAAPVEEVAPVEEGAPVEEA